MDQLSGVGPETGEWERACQLFDQGLALLAASAPGPTPRLTSGAQTSGGTQLCRSPTDMQRKRETWLSVTRPRQVAGTLPDSVQEIIRQLQALPPGSWEEVCRLIDQGFGTLLIADSASTPTAIPPTGRHGGLVIRRRELRRYHWRQAWCFGRRCYVRPRHGWRGVQS